jgi:methyl-accepting chemotaxis protein
VAANEVKELAKQTAQVTEDVSRKIEAIQGGCPAGGGGDPGDQRGGPRINDFQTTIAEAVEKFRYEVGPGESQPGARRWPAQRE